jgi:hypothetical protein
MPNFTHRLPSLILALACGAVFALANGTPAAAADDGWTTLRDPRGFIVDVPRGWSLRYNDEGHRVTVVDPSASAGAVMAIVGTRTPLATDAQVARYFSSLLLEADDRLPGTSPLKVTNSVWHTSARSPERASEAYFTWNTAKSLSVGYLYGGWTSPGANASVVKKIWKSYRVAIPSTTAAGAAGADVQQLRFARIDEPIEHAFTVELPASWKSGAGINRTSDVATVASFWSEIPGSVRIQMGDPQIPVYRLPDWQTQFAKKHEGDVLQNLSSRVVIRHYIGGPAYARRYAMGFGSWCKNVQIISAKEDPEWAAPLNAQRLNMPLHYDYGHVSFTCTLKGTPMRGQILMGTGISNAPGQGGANNGVSLWWVDRLLFWFAKPELAATAESALEHAWASYRVSPKWTADRDEATRRNIEITRQNLADTSKILSDMHANKVASDDRISTIRANANRGVRTAVDPATGQKFTVDNSYSNAWISSDGTIIGSNVSARPSAAVRQIIMSP